jgi:Xaa-Pro aminopeptidase
MNPPYEERYNVARMRVASYGLDAVLVTNLSTIRYLSGFTGSDGIVVQGADAGWFMTDGRYTSQAKLEVTAYAVSEYRNKFESVSELIKNRRFGRIGFEADSLTVAQFRQLEETLAGIELVPVNGDFQNIRIRKDLSEITMLAKVAELASGALVETLDLLAQGVRERDVAWALESAMRTAGADDKSFDTIVASGPRGALPHGKATDRLINMGELVTIDFGAVMQGYHSDETVTVAVGNPDEQQKKIHGIVKDAHDCALAAVRPGIPLKELDRIARSFIEAQGYGDYFGHGLGHGVGLDVHEPPTVSWRGEMMAEEGMVFTIEPGIYIPGWGGVRIEDTVVVTSDGCTVLTRAPKELISLH